jgi:hypothetical protein
MLNPHQEFGFFTSHHTASAITRPFWNSSFQKAESRFPFTIRSQIPVVSGHTTIHISGFGVSFTFPSEFRHSLFTLPYVNFEGLFPLTINHQPVCQLPLNVIFLFIWIGTAADIQI